MCVCVCVCAHAYVCVCVCVYYNGSTPLDPAFHILCSSDAVIGINFHAL